jgi:hypothetical protein
MSNLSISKGMAHVSVQMTPKALWGAAGAFAAAGTIVWLFTRKW